MFWDLKGATRRPRVLRMRQIPAVSTDFPTSEAVPTTITALPEFRAGGSWPGSCLFFFPLSLSVSPDTAR